MLPITTYTEVDQVIDSGCLLSYLSIDSLIMMYFVSSKVRAKLADREVLHRICLQLDLVTPTVPTSLWQLVLVHDKQRVCCRTPIVYSMLFDRLNTAMLNRDYSSAYLYSDIGCNCECWITLAKSTGRRDVKSAMHMTKFNGVHNEGRAPHLDLYRVRVPHLSSTIGYDLGYREVISLLRHATINMDNCVKYYSQLCASVLPSIILSRDTQCLRKLLNRDTRGIASRIISSLDLKSMIFAADVLKYTGERLVTIMVARAVDCDWDACLRWATVYRVLHPKCAIMQVTTERVVNVCARAKDKNADSDLGELVASIINKTFNLCIKNDIFDQTD